jgi:hypothetical protein
MIDMRPPGYQGLIRAMFLKTLVPIARAEEGPELSGTYIGPPVEIKPG